MKIDKAVKIGIPGVGLFQTFTFARLFCLILFYIGISKIFYFIDNDFFDFFIVTGHGLKFFLQCFNTKILLWNSWHLYKM